MSEANSPNQPAVDFTAVKTRQQATWSSGNYSVVGAMLQIVGENLGEAMDLRAGSRVLDVAAGNGNATLAAAHRWCDVTSTDYVPSLLKAGQCRAQAEGYDIRFQEADAENLPFRDASFDAVMSTFGVMFTPDQEKSASEMARVCRPGGKIGLANWTPESFIGQVFKTIGSMWPRRPASSRRRCGARGTGWKRCSARLPPRSALPAALLSSASARRNTGWKCSALTMGRCTRPLPRSMPRNRRR
jgi:SAM-dependent methyltransferase